MARFLALFLLTPCLIVLGWLYWMYVRRRATNDVPARFDAMILVVAAVCAIVGASVAYEAAIGHGDRIWKQLIAPVGAYAGFNIVLFAGLLRHWLVRRRTPAAPTD